MQFLKLFIPILIAVFIILVDYKFSYLDGVKQPLARLISPIYLLVNFPAQLYTWISERGTDKEELLNQNKRLKNELIRLKANLQTYNALSLENQKLTRLLGASYTAGDQALVLAKIVSVSQSRLKKQIIINKGSNDNVEVGQIVLGVDGVVGQTTQVTPWYATVLMITDPTQHVPVKNQRNGVRGVSKGAASQQNKLQVNFIESKLDVKLGDIFISSAIGGKFPDGYPVGKVSTIKKFPNQPFLHIELTPFQTSEQLEFVLVKRSDP